MEDVPGGESMFGIALLTNRLHSLSLDRKKCATCTALSPAKAGR
jgi:hypothetical protein